MSSPTNPIPPDQFGGFVPFLGMFISGDVGGYTVYTTRKGKIVWYPASPALKPPSAAQVKQRLRFKIAQAQWHALPSSTKATWEQLTKTLAVPVTGQNVYISLALKPNNDQLNTALRKTHLSLSPPSPVPN